MKHKFLLAVVVLATFLLAACSMGGMMNGGNMAGMDHSNISSGSMSSTMAMTETMPMTSTMAGMDHGNIQMGNSNEPFDLLFIDSMIVHHQGAIEMAIEAQQEATKAEIKSLADAIIAAQEAEIQQMQEWRAVWYPDAVATEGIGMDMGTMAVAAGDTLYDLRFIEAMIPHHKGAIGMAQSALTMSEHPELKSLAGNIIQAQEAEIAQMQEWQAAWEQ